MLKMKKNVLKITAVLGLASVLLNSCGPKENTPLVYFPDMYFPVAYDPLMKAQDAYSDHENEIPAFVKNNGATGLSPVEGSVAQNKDGVFEEGKLPKNPDEYNAGYDASKSLTSSPLNPANAAKDIERGKMLFDRTCSACHGTGGDGQGPIVQSGAYSGVPNYADREITVGSVHYVLTNGRNAMGSYAGQLNAGDRWRVAMYVINAFKKGAPAAAAASATAAKTDSTATKK
ncbi:cytochrome c [Chryseobacterium aahli]|uniref:c-type cytochrome n=1 Tax=Chryseobacterium aahli TaxID=1278643 RepID=UPI001F60AC4F|nr:cytochrome c [Chryseobacterium aahli]MCI3938855.1 cytochrome c [Chryseobacterium aahli]